MRDFRRQLEGLATVVRELGRIADYDAEANRLYRQLRTQHSAPARGLPRLARPGRERQERPGRNRAAIAGLATFLVVWYLLAAPAASAAVNRPVPSAR